MDQKELQSIGTDRLRIEHSQDARMTSRFESWCCSGIMGILNKSLPRPRRHAQGGTITHPCTKQQVRDHLIFDTPLLTHAGRTDEILSSYNRPPQVPSCVSPTPTPYSLSSPALHIASCTVISHGVLSSVDMAGPLSSLSQRERPICRGSRERERSKDQRYGLCTHMDPSVQPKS